MPMERSGTTDDIGKAVLFLASDMSKYTTGHTLMVDGGWMAANLFDARKMGIKQSTENRLAGIVKTELMPADLMPDMEHILYEVRDRVAVIT